MSRKRRKWSKEELDKLLNEQIARLKNRDAPQVIIDRLVHMCARVIWKASKMSFPEGRIPFIPVIPRHYCFGSIMPLVFYNEKVGRTNLDWDSIGDVVDTPTTPYYMFDVARGANMVSHIHRNTKQIIKKQKRLPLTHMELIALCIHTDVLSQHFVGAFGSQHFWSGSDVPVIYLIEDRPVLAGSRIIECSGASWAAPSCKIRE